MSMTVIFFFFFSSRRRHTRLVSDWSSDVCSSDLEQYFKRQDEMAQLFADIPHALSNSIEIARRCNLAIELGKNRLPAFPTPPGVTVDDHLKAQAQIGLERRALHQNARYRERLEFEIRTIVQMGYAGYFLIVADF